MTRAEQHAHRLIRVSELARSYLDSPALKESAALIREMQAAIEGAPHADDCAIYQVSGVSISEGEFGLNEYGNPCDCFKAPFL